MAQQPRSSTARQPGGQPSLRDQQRQLTRSALVDAASRTFETKGFVGATVDDIVSAAGASRATFYVHFKNKDEVAQALFEMMAPQSDEAFAGLDQAVASGSPGDVRDWLRRAFDWYDANRGAVLALEQIVASGGFGHGGLEQVQTDAMPALLERWGPARREEARLRVYLLSTLVTRAHRAWRIDGLFASLDDDAVLDVLAELMISGLRPRGPLAGPQS